MINDRRTLILYSTAVCNLNCVYCFIDKNPALVQIDQLLDKSYQDNYYLNFAKEIFPDPTQLTEIQIWGGEPTLNFHRIGNTIKSLLEYYLNISTVMFSTNLAHDKAVDEIFYLCKCLKCNHDITLNIQLSVDGPTYINDANRGKGTTEKFVQNFRLLVSKVDSLLKTIPNLYIQAFNKSTLDISSIQQLQTKEAIIDYYKFIETFKDISLFSTSNNFVFDPNIPNTACPLPITKKIGLQFTNLCKLCTELEKENQKNPIFKYLKIITPFKRMENYSCGFCNHGTCGSGKYSIGLLPDRMISTCHNGFTELISDYKKYANENNITELQQNFFATNSIKNQMVFSFEELKRYEEQVEQFYTEDINFASAMVGQIQSLAFVNQIDSKYKNISEAVKAVEFIMLHTATCVRDNINITGAKILVPVNLLKLLLNGAKEYIQDNSFLNVEEDN